MDQQPLTEQDIASILEDLKSSDASVRRYRAKELRSAEISDERIIEALNTLASSDASASVRKEAVKTLTANRLSLPQRALERAKRRKDFWLGVGIFFGLNFLLYTLYFNQFLAGNSLPWVINIGLLIFLAFKRPQMAFGMLVGFAISLAVVVILFVWILVTCFSG